MLKKLFKYEWKFFWKVPTAINLFLIIITIVGVISLASPFWETEARGMDIMFGLAIFFYILAIAAGSIAVTVYIAIRYYKNVYTDEGYLTNTLPVTARQIVLSKLFTGMIWSFLTGAVVMISVFSLVYTAALSGGDKINLLAEFISYFPEFLQEFREGTGIGFGLFLFLCLIDLVLSTAFSILQLYSAIALGQLFARHKVAGAVIWFIGEYVLFQTVTSFIGNGLSYNNGLLFTFMNSFAFMPNSYRFGAILMPSLLISIGITFAFCCGLYFITEHMLKNQLNLD